MYSGKKDRVSTSTRLNLRLQTTKRLRHSSSEAITDSLCSIKRRRLNKSEINDCDTLPMVPEATPPSDDQIVPNYEGEVFKEEEEMYSDDDMLLM